MSYLRQLHPWCVIRILPNQQQLDDASVLSSSPQSSVVARFRRRDDAVAYLQVLQKSTKNIKFLIIFDMQGVQNPSENDALN
jgi:hypothetical protein